RSRIRLKPRERRFSKLKRTLGRVDAIPTGI
ncbi:chain length determinant family protein, partial [Vibrio cholerae HC-50A2]